MKKYFFSFWIVTLLSLFLYSFTQVDLGLTLTRISFWQDIQRSFQFIGYFNRPLSTVLYSSIVVLLWVGYIMAMKLVKKNELDQKSLWKLIIGMSVLFIFSYSAFSYDIFNYVFDAKIVTYYQQSPFEHKALDYPQDPMLSFMHWTHRLYPYGYTWLGLTVPLSFLGFQYFLPTYFLFKTLMALCYLATVYFIGRILRSLSPKDELLGVVFFALNPLVIIESLVSSHNDIAMMAITFASLYLLVAKKYIPSILMFIASIGVKFATIFLTPVYLYVLMKRVQKKGVPWDRVFLAAVVLMIGGVLGATYRTNFQPWYLLNILPFCALLVRKYYVVVPTIVVTFFALVLYVPFLYTGNWDQPIPKILDTLMVSSIGISCLGILIYPMLMKKFMHKL